MNDVPDASLLVKKYKPNAVTFLILPQAHFLCTFYSQDVKWSP